MLYVDQNRLFREIRYVPHLGQAEILNDNTRFQVVSAGRRFGKSDVGGHKLLPEAFLAYYRRNELRERNKRMEFWITGPEYSDAEKEFRVLWNRLSNLGVPFDKPGTYNDPLGGNMHISLWEGRFQVHGKSAKHPETLVGEGLHGVIVAEAAKVKERVWTKFLRPTLNDFQGWALLSSTPEGKNWFYDAYMRGLNPAQRAWRSWRKPAWHNPHVYPGSATDSQIETIRWMISQNIDISEAFIAAMGINPEIVQLILDLTEETFKQEIAADFSEFVGRVFKQFDEDVHVTSLKYNPEWKTYAAVDYGFTNPNVWLLIQEDPFGNFIHVLGEVYEPGLSPAEFADEILRRNLCPANTIAFFPDPASPGDTRILEDRLRVRSRGHTGGPINLRLDAIRQALKVPFQPGDKLRRPRIMFDVSCRETIRDMTSYRYPETKAEQGMAREAPMKKDDHAPEALGRYFAGRFGTAAKQARRTRQHDAEMRSA